MTVLGNHDVHLLAVASGQGRLKASDTFGDVLTAPDRQPCSPGCGIVRCCTTMPHWG